MYFSKSNKNKIGRNYLKLINIQERYGGGGGNYYRRTHKNIWISGEKIPYS